MRKRRHFGLTLLFSFAVFCVILVSLLVGAAVVYLVTHLGQYDPALSGPKSLLEALLLMVVISTVVGFLVAMLASRIPLKPINRFIDRMNQLASGDFKARMEFGPPMGELPSFAELSRSFNTMAKELEGTELLRTDFINNFSHEFKTPIVSIAGFAKLLKRGNLPEETRREYLDIIEAESLRLSRMATNVLSLTKVESQNILAEVSTFNLSEQIRTGILMFIDELEKKGLEIRADFGEHSITGSEELLKQVWLNLISNAVKFSAEYGTVVFGIREEGGRITVTVQNDGETIPPDKQEKIFNKFYQGDLSHATEGNGIGLAVAKKVVELHRGTIGVHSENGLTTFTVELPKTQTRE